MKKQLANLKQELKTLAKHIRELKDTRKKVPYGYVPELWNPQFEFRHRHIAYCLLRGRKMQEIEQKTREDNKPNMNYVNNLIAKIKEEAQDEDVRDCA